MPREAVSNLFAEIGDAGAANAALALADALDKAAAGETLLALAAGAGAIALELHVSDRPATVRGGPTVATKQPPDEKWTTSPISATGASCPATPEGPHDVVRFPAPLRRFDRTAG